MFHKEPWYDGGMEGGYLSAEWKGHEKSSPAEDICYMLNKADASSRVDPVLGFWSSGLAGLFPSVVQRAARSPIELAALSGGKRPAGWIPRRSDAAGHYKEK